MTRPMSAAMEAALLEKHTRPVYLFDAAFDDFDLALSSAAHTVTWSGHGYLGNGWLQAPGAFRENSTDESDGATIILSGIPVDLVSLILSQTAGLVIGQLFYGLFDADGSLIEDPIELYYGYLDSPEYSMDPENPQITLNFEDELIDFESAIENRFTHECQRIYYPNDRGFEYALQKFNGLWGRPKSKEPKKDKPTRRTSGR